MTSNPLRTLRLVRHFEASPQRVFDAWLDPARAGKWLFATPKGEMVRVEIDARVGGSWTFVRREADGLEIAHVGKYLEIDRPRRLVFEFAVPQFAKEVTRVSVEIAPTRGGGCDLTLTHEGVLPEWAEGSQRGWGKILSALASDVDPNSAAYGVVTEPGTIRFERLLSGPIERVWSYLADSDKRGQWFAFGQTEGRVGGVQELKFNHSKISTDLTPAPKGFEHYTDPAGGPEYRQTITHYDPPRKLSWTWDGGIDGAASEVTFELTPQADGKVLLVLTHRRIDGKHLPGIAGGWHQHLAVLVDRLSDREVRAFWMYGSDVEGVYEKRLE